MAHQKGLPFQKLPLNFYHPGRRLRHGLYFFYTLLDATPLFTALQKIAVKLFDIVFCKGNIGGMLKDNIHHLRIARHFLFITGRKPFNIQIIQQCLYLLIVQLASLDPR
jgi:hypothetical protein